MRKLTLTRRLGRLLAALRLSDGVDALDKLVARDRSQQRRSVPDGGVPRPFP